MTLLRFFYKQRGVLAAPPLIFAAFWLGGRVENTFLTWGLGLFVFALGLWGRVWTQEHLRYRLKTQMILTRTGPYNFVRNPIYISNTLLFAGLVFTSRVLWLVPVTVLWYAVLYSFVVREEEQRLLRDFGDKYKNYLDETSRWFPRGRGKLELFNSFLFPSVKIESYNLLLLIPFVVKEFLTR